jgi:glycosyltransferase involved in cell wall biosynthesis
MKPANSQAPQIAVVIPTFDRPDELRFCLEGFALQTATAEQFEVVVIDDGSAEDIEEVTAGFQERLPLHVERCAHAGVSVARNLGIARARAPLLLLYDDDLQPLPDLIESCLYFHDRYSALHQVELLPFVPHPDIADMALVRWAFDRLYPFPESPGVHQWEYFWGGAVTCKRSLFARQVFDPEYLAVEDAEFALRAAAQNGLEVHFTPRTRGLFHRRLSITQLCRRQYRMAYYRYLMAQRHDVHLLHSVYVTPEDFVIADWASYRAMLSATQPQESAVLSPSSPKFRLLCGLWQKADLHATASGWLAAQAGRPPETSLFE